MSPFRCGHRWVHQWLAGRPVWVEVTVVTVLALLAFRIGCTAVPILGRDEGRFAQAAREMDYAGDLVVPTFGGRDRYDKPILIYWCVIASYRLLGVSAGSARLPSNLAAALTVGLIAWWARRRWGPGAGLVAGALLAVTPTFHLQARACTADQVMLLPTTAAMLAMATLWRGSARTAPRLVLWVALALAVLAKGPVAPMVLVSSGLGLWALGRQWPRWQLLAVASVLVLGLWVGPWVLVVIGAWAVAELPRRPELRRLLRATGWWWGAPLSLLLVLPWSVAAWRATDGAFFAEAVGRHVVERSLTALESHGGFPGFYAVTAVAVAFPLLAFALAAVRERWRSVIETADGRFLLAWLLAPMVVLELLGTKLVHYWLPSYPAAALLVAGWWAAGDARRRTAWWPLLGCGALILALVPLVVAVHLDLDALVAPAVVVGAVLLGSSVVACWSWRQRGARAGLGWAVVSSGAFLLALLVWFLPLLAPSLLPVRVAAAVASLRTNGEPVLVYQVRDDDLLFQLPLETEVCRSRECLLDCLAAGPFLGVARAEDLRELRGEQPMVAVDEVATIYGVELGRGRWRESVVFRTAEQPGSGATTVR